MLKGNEVEGLKRFSRLRFTVQDARTPIGVPEFTDHAVSGICSFSFC